MPISFTVASTAPGRTKADVLAVPVTAGGTLGAGGDAVTAGFPGALDTFMARAGFEGKPGQALFVPLEGDTASALLVGLGQKGWTSPADAKEAPVPDVYNPSAIKFPACLGQRG